jgi:hypothetical protein
MVLFISQHSFMSPCHWLFITLPSTLNYYRLFVALIKTSHTREISCMFVNCKYMQWAILDLSASCIALHKLVHAWHTKIYNKCRKVRSINKYLSEYRKIFGLGSFNICQSFAQIFAVCGCGTPKPTYRWWLTNVPVPGIKHQYAFLCQAILLIWVVCNNLLQMLHRSWMPGCHDTYNFLSLFFFILSYKFLSTPSYLSHPLLFLRKYLSSGLMGFLILDYLLLFSYEIGFDCNLLKIILMIKGIGVIYM